MPITLLYASIESLSAQSMGDGQQFQIETNYIEYKTRIAWKAALRKYLDLPVLEIDYTTGGKPYFIDPTLPHFSISHTQDTLLIALSAQGKIGCDIEQLRPRKQWQALAKEVFTETERQWIDQQPSKINAFWVVWSLKEACLKLESRTVWEMPQLALPLSVLEKHHPLMQFLIQSEHVTAICSTQAITEVQSIDWR